MNTKATNFILLGSVILAAALCIFVYPWLPDEIAAHWNASGEADGTMPKLWGLFLLPAIMAGLFVLYVLIPKIDPLRANIESFRKHYNLFWIFMSVFFLYILCLVIAWNFGYTFNFAAAIILATAGLFYVLGGILEKSKRNWFFGIRTPWTLSSDVVWDKTHALGGRLFKVAAAVSLVGIFFPGEAPVIFSIVPLLAAAGISAVYSYVIYKKQPH